MSKRSAVVFVGTCLTFACGGSGASEGGDAGPGVGGSAGVQGTAGSSGSGGGGTAGADAGGGGSPNVDAATDAPGLPDVSPPPPGFAPCGGAAETLWSWAWAGNDGEFLELTPPQRGIQRIEFMQDLSGNGHHYENRTGSEQPGYMSTFQWTDPNDASNTYRTDLPIVAANASNTLFEQWMTQSVQLDADGEFYLAFAGMNTRDGGNREVWGTTPEDNVGLDQEREQVRLAIAGSSMSVSQRGVMDRKGALLLEIWRESDDTIVTWVNGQDVSSADVRMGGTFALSGIGADMTGSSGWDDQAFEYVVCKGATPDMRRRETRDYLRGKWGLF